MPYFIYRIKPGPTALIKNIELINEFDAFKEAKEFAKQERIDHADGDDIQIKVMFADNQLLAEEQIMEKREGSIAKEWEK